MSIRALLLASALFLSLNSELAIAEGSYALDTSEPTKNGFYQISANWSELRRGWNTLTFQVYDSEQKSIATDEVSVSYDMESMPMDPPDEPIIDKGDGLYEKRIFLGMRGGWKFDFKLSKNKVEDTYSKSQAVR